MPLSPPKRRQILLSQQELFAISESIGRDYTPRFSRHGRAGAHSAHFSSRELLDISQQIGRDFAPQRQAEQSQLVLMTVSPRRLHVYWQLAQQKSRANALSLTAEALSPDSEELMLRIYGHQATPLAEHEDAPDPMLPESANSPSSKTKKVSNTDVQTALSSEAGLAFDAPAAALPPVNDSADLHSVNEPSWIDVVVKHCQGQQDIVLPETFAATSPNSEAIRYNAVLGRMGADQHFKPLVYSNVMLAQSAPRSFEDNPLAPTIEQFIMQKPAPSSSRAHAVSGPYN